MAFFIMTRAGFESLVANFGRVPDNTWVNRDVLSRPELDAFVSAGVSITNFTIEVPTDNRVAINKALDTIADHHPGEPVNAEWTDC